MAVGRREHGAEVLVLGHAVDRLVIEPIVAGDGVCAVTPQQGDQIDARDHAMVLARPMAMDERDVLGIGLVQRRVVNDQEPVVQDDMLLGLHPERRWIRLQALKEAGQRIMGSTAGGVRLHACGFRTAEDGRGGHQKIDVVQVGHFRCVHSPTIPHNEATA